MNEGGIDRITRVHYNLTGFGQFSCEKDNDEVHVEDLDDGRGEWYFGYFWCQMIGNPYTSLQLQILTVLGRSLKQFNPLMILSFLHLCVCIN
jgi:hypothetical protein